MIKMMNVPKKDDKLIKQYYSDAVEIRANMTRLTGSGTLIARVENVNDQVKCSRIKDIENIYKLLIIAVK